MRKRCFTSTYIALYRYKIILHIYRILFLRLKALLFYAVYLYQPAK